MATSKRSVERDYPFYDPPEVIWRKLHLNERAYRTFKLEEDRENLRLRDKALISLLYLTCSRASEISRAVITKANVRFSMPSVQRRQFVQIGSFIMVRELRNMKVKHIKKAGKWKPLEHGSEYPLRPEIELPLEGGLAKFTKYTQQYLASIDKRPETELFPFDRKQTWRIVNDCTGEFPHYYREMGLKLRLRLFDRDIAQLKNFSGHRRTETLMRYLTDSQRAESRTRMLEYE